MSPHILNIAGSWDKEIYPTTPKTQNNTTPKKPEAKKENPAHERNFVEKVVFLVNNSKHKLAAFYKFYYQYFLHL